MRAYRSAGLSVALVVAGGMLLGAGVLGEQLPLEPRKEFGQPVYPVFEGWYKNDDGSFTLLAGYYNPNTTQTLDIPVGPDNRVEAGGPDLGQPTHFDTGRGWGVFTIRVPNDFGDKKLTWVITANNQTASVPMHLDSQWYIEPFEDAANKNRPPTLRFTPGGPRFEGPPIGIATSLTTAVSTPLAVTVWTTDVKPTRNLNPGSLGRRRTPGLTLTWQKFRGPGDVTFDKARQEFDASDQEVTTTARFSEPGEYLLRVEANDETGAGGGGAQCCWTSTVVKVTVTGGGRVTSGQ